MKTDIVVEIIYNMKDSGQTVIRTNAKQEAVPEILEAWVMGQVGQGVDHRNPKKKDEYKISINLDLSDDTFRTSSDTGNHGLTAGLVLDVVKNLDKVRISLL